MKRASSPPEATFISGPGRSAGIGADPELHAVDAFGHRRVGGRGDRGREPRLLELERLELGVHRLVEGFRDLPAPFRKFCRRRRIALGRGVRLLLQRGEPRRTGIDQREVRRIARGERGKLVDRRHVFAAGSAQREQPLLDALELVGIVGRGGERLLDMAARLVERGERRIERLHRRLDVERRLGVAALEPPHGRRQHRHRRLRARHHRFRLAQILGDLLRLHHAGAAAGERGLLARLRRELGKLLRGMAQPVRLALGALDLGAMAGDLLLRGAAQRP